MSNMSTFGLRELARHVFLAPDTDSMVQQGGQCIAEHVAWSAVRCQHAYLICIAIHHLSTWQHQRGITESDTGVWDLYRLWSRWTARVWSCLTTPNAAEAPEHKISKSLKMNFFCTFSDLNRQPHPHVRNTFVLLISILPFLYRAFWCTGATL